MIRIAQYPPPGKYFSQVRRRGQAYLARNPKPSASEFNRHAYWSEVHSNLYRLYNGVCAYCASWTPRTPSSRLDQTSVDHFIPKSISPTLAYEWDNFRLCRSRLNANKAASMIVDPFYVMNGWFQLDFATFLINADDSLPPYIEASVTDTIGILSLNDNDYVNERIEVIKRYCLGKITYGEVAGAYPFIASEMLRAEFDRTLLTDMGDFFRKQQ